MRPFFIERLFLGISQDGQSWPGGGGGAKERVKDTSQSTDRRTDKKRETEGRKMVWGKKTLSIIPA